MNNPEDARLQTAKDGTMYDKTLSGIPQRPSENFTPQPRPLPGSDEDRNARALAALNGVTS
jgi:hypothetical protein